MLKKLICLTVGHDPQSDSKRDTRNNQDLIEENCLRCGESLDEELSPFMQVLEVIRQE